MLIDDILALINRADAAEITIRAKFSTVSPITPEQAQQVHDALSGVVTNLEQDASK